MAKAYRIVVALTMQLEGGWTATFPLDRRAKLRRGSSLEPAIHCECSGVSCRHRLKRLQRFWQNLHELTAVLIF
jgi:hypothetical protein